MLVTIYTCEKLISCFPRDCRNCCRALQGQLARTALETNTHNEEGSVLNAWMYRSAAGCLNAQHAHYALHTHHCKGLPLGGIRCRTSPRTRVTPSVAVRYNNTTPSEGPSHWLALSLVNCLVAMERLGNSLCAASLIRRLSILPSGAGPVQAVLCCSASNTC